MTGLTKKLLKMYSEKGITTCEARIQPMCWNFRALSWHHRHKRRWYITKNKSREPLLASMNQTILVCGPCHEYLEQHPDETRKYFEKLRGPEILVENQKV